METERHQVYRRSRGNEHPTGDTVKALVRDHENPASTFLVQVGEVDVACLDHSMPSKAASSSDSLAANRC